VTSIAFPGVTGLVPVPLGGEDDSSSDPGYVPALIGLLREAEAAAAWLVTDQDGYVLGWLAARLVPLAGRSAGAVRRELRVDDPIGPVEESMVETDAGRAFRLVQRHGIPSPTPEDSDAQRLAVHASWSWALDSDLLILSTSSDEPALAEVLVARIDDASAKMVVDA
jgi:hypothetical protein